MRDTEKITTEGGSNEWIEPLMDEKYSKLKKHTEIRVPKSTMEAYKMGKTV